LTRFRFFQCANQIFRFSGSGQADKHISSDPKRRHLTRENFVEAIVVPSGSEYSAITRETNRRKRPSIFGKPYYKFRRKMRSISRTSTIPAYQQLVSCTQALIDQICCLSKLRIKDDERLQSLHCGGNRFMELQKIRHGVDARF
jgi:hypothetical protein